MPESHLTLPPPGFKILRHGNNTYMVGHEDQELLDYLLENGRLRHLLNAIKPAENAGGRGATATVNLPGSKHENGILRKGLRGGIFRKILGRTYWGSRTRMFDEVAITEYALQNGLPVPKVLLAGREPVFPFCYRGWIITREISPSDNLADFFQQFPPKLSEQNNQEKKAILHDLAEIIAKMHHKNIIHADLHVKNILIRNDATGKKQIFLIDFDKSTVVRQITMKQRLKNLMRLFRSFEKQPGLAKFMDHEEKINFLTTYFQGNQTTILQAEHMLENNRLKDHLHRLIWHITGHKRD